MKVFLFLIQICTRRTPLQTDKFMDASNVLKSIKNKKKCNEYRPINTLKTCEMIMEKVVKEQYLEPKKILSKYESGFRKKNSRAIQQLII